MSDDRPAPFVVENELYDAWLETHATLTAGEAPKRRVLGRRVFAFRGPVCVSITYMNPDQDAQEERRQLWADAADISAECAECHGSCPECSSSWNDEDGL